MNSPSSSLPLNDPERLSALAGAGLMDSAQEESFDRYTRLCARWLMTPVSLVSLVDDRRQFFKSSCGLTEPLATVKETPLTHSFCQWVVNHATQMVVENAREDERVRDNLAVSEMGVVAYLGMPLKDSEGHVLGSLCAIDTRPRIWSKEEIETLEDLAAGVSTEIQLRQRLRQYEQQTVVVQDLSVHLADTQAEKELHFRKICEELPHLVWTCRADGECDYLSPQWVAFTGIPAAEQLGYRWAKQVHPDDQAAAVSAWRQSLDGGEPFECDFRIRRADGVYRWFNARAVLLRTTDGQHDKWFGTSTDIHDKKEMGDALREAHQQVEAASKAKDEFLAFLSHELRTPLNPALILTTHLEASEDLESELKEDIGIIRRCIEMEARLIDDLLDLTRIRSGKFSLDVVQLSAHAMITDLMAHFESDFRAGGIFPRLELNAPQCWVTADEVRLKQVIWNLLRNAIKFTPVGGEICLRSRNEGSPGRLIIDVSDTGVGMEPWEVEEIFDAFQQGTKKEGLPSGGLGLGLTLARKLMEAHQGTISAQSAGPGSGSVFTIDMPVLPKAPSHAALPAASASQAEKSPETNLRRVLLVEDHDVTRITLARLLTKKGFHIEAACSIAEAELLASVAIFDLVLSDVGLQDGSGHDLMRSLKERYGLSGIALSGFGMAHDHEESLQAGFISHLTKPVNIGDLLRELELAFSRPGLIGGRD